MMFLTTYVQIIVMTPELFQRAPLRWLIDKTPFLNTYRRAIVACVLATLGIAWEQPHRRVDITYYIIPRVLEIYWNILKNRKIVKADIPFQSGFCTAIAFGIVAYKLSEETSVKEKKKVKVDAEVPAVRVHDNNSIRGFSFRACASLWGNHHTVLRRRDSIKSSSQSVLDQETEYISLGT